MKIIFCGGGTVGHVSPAIAIAESLLKTNPKNEILFIGREGGEENAVIEKAGFELKTVTIRGFQRKFCTENLKNIHLALSAFRKSKSIIKNFAPDAVIGTGGYVSWPVIKAAQRLGIPTLIHESNACPGLVTKYLASKCDRVLLNLNGSEKEFKRKDNIKIVGNPVREEFTTQTRDDARRKLGIAHGDFLIASFGGSGGAEKINSAAIALMKSHSSKNKNIRHIHSCGNKYYKALKKLYPDFASGSDGCIIKPYIDNIATVMAASDAVISRCGAMTLSEMSASGVAAILVPSPNVTNNHQFKNAKLLCDKGAAIMIEEENLNERTLLDAVRKLESDMKLRKELSEKIQHFYIKNTKELILNEIENLI